MTVRTDRCFHNRVALSALMTLLLGRFLLRRLAGPKIMSALRYGADRSRTVITHPVGGETAHRHADIFQPLHALCD